MLGEEELKRYDFDPIKESVPNSNVGGGYFPPPTNNSLKRVSVLQFNTILMLTAQGEKQIPQVKGSALRFCYPHFQRLKMILLPIP